MQKNSPRINLKKGKERPILQRHHWIYSGAIAKISSHEPGDIAEVFAADGEKLGLALLNEGHSISAHMIAFGQETLHEALKSRLQTAISLRKKWFDPKVTNGVRLINAEGDGIPGLVIDSYADVLVMQISHLGIEKMKDLLVSLMIEIYAPRTIYEKSTSFMRKKEGMKEARSHIYGEIIPEIDILENGLKYSIDLIEGQKTGFFLDQRETRNMVTSLSCNKRVLNCFAYTGGASIAALAGGALHVDSVEISAKCQSRLEKNISLNQLSFERHRFIAADVFDFLKTCDWNYDLVILDPPAFVKKRDDVAKAFRAYKDMNSQAMRKMAPGSLLLTCSCSYHIEESLFQNILFRAATEAKRSIRIISRHRMAFDHPISIFHPESAYLKSFLLAID
jgi:23S rRNA (cytosine1962-C5)-methyltransferase